MSTDHPTSVSNSAPNASTEWLLVDAHDVLWLLPRSEALYLGPFTTGPHLPPACGQQEYHGQRYPVVYWNRRLKLDSPRERSCSTALLLQGESGFLALACRRVIRVEQPPEFHALPACMRGRHAWFTDVAVIRGRAAAKACADQMMAQLPAELVTPRAQRRNATGG